MPAIKRITNSNSNVATKVNYFIDRFHHHVIYGGTEWHMELENQLSLIEKIHFQLTEDSTIRLEYFDNYFTHDYFSDLDNWKLYPAYLSISQIIADYKSLQKDKAKKTSLLNQISFQKGLEKLLEELRFRMPENLIKYLLSIFMCDMPLEENEHVDKLNLIAKLIVSEGYFSGKSTNDLTEVVNRIFFDKKDDGDGERLFPYPLEVKKSGRKKFLNNHLLENQIRGFKSVMQENPNKGIIIIRIFGSVRLPDDYEFEYNKVYFLGSEATKILKLRASIPQSREDFNNFFSNEECFYVAANIEWFSVYNIKYKIREIIADQVNYVSTMLKRNLEVDHTDCFITATRQWKFVGGSYSLSNEIRPFLDFELKVLKTNSIFNSLAQCKNSPAAQLIQSLEPQFIRAFKSNIIADYWKYLEALIPLTSKGNKQVKDIISKVLLINEKNTSHQRIIQTMLQAFDIFNGGYSTLGVDLKDFSKIRNQLMKKKIPKAIRDLKYPFIQELVDEFDKVMDSIYYEKARQYYEGILTEAYAIRNFDVHSGTGNNRSLTKIEKTFPKMIFRLRGLILQTIKENPKVSMNLIVEILLEKHSQLMTT